MPKQRAVDEGFFARATSTVTMQQAINVPAEVVFDSFTRDEDWKHWLGLDVEWTSPEPKGVGSTRTVKPGPGVAIKERFIIWDAPNRMTFHFESSPFPVSAFAEDYRVEETGPASSVLHWTIAVDGFWPIAKAVTVGMSVMGNRGLPKLAALLEQRAA